MIEVLYMGPVLINGAMCIKLCPIIEGVPMLSRASIFSKPKRNSLTLQTGYVYSAEASLNDSSEIDALKYGDMKMLRKAPEELFKELVIIEAAVKTEYGMLTKAKTDLNTILDEALAPIKSAMRKTNYQGRAAILALVVSKLNR